MNEKKHSCYHCGDENLKNFHKVRRNERKLRGVCKKCEVEYAQKYRARIRLVTVNKYGEGNKLWGQKNKKALARLKRKWVTENRYKIRAHQMVYYAVKGGKLKKLPCEKCGTNKNIQAHHDDYSKPLIVRWMCNKHHSWHHHNIKVE